MTEKVPSTDNIVHIGSRDNKYAVEMTIVLPSDVTLSFHSASSRPSLPVERPGFQSN